MTAYLESDVVDLHGTRLLRCGEGQLYAPESAIANESVPTEPEPSCEAAGSGGENQGQHPAEPTPEQTGETGRNRPGRLTDAVAARRRRARRYRAAGLTGRVRRSRDRSAEAEQLADVPDRGVIRRRRRNQVAAERERLASDPYAEAYANRRVRAVALAMSFTGIALGVSISSSAAQTTIATVMGWTADQIAYWLAYGADPALGLVLFASLLVRTVASARGVALPDQAKRMFTRVEIGLFALVAVLNAGPSVAGLITVLWTGAWSSVGTALMVLVIHTLGPVLVATGVFALPYVLDVLAWISVATTAKTTAIASRGDHQPALRGHDQVLAALDSGELSSASASAIARFLGCDKRHAARLRDVIKGSEAA
ncbi:hypothetical protein FHX42_002661 [Saccharopolyspora lacisalsi]|uniref:Uncharacterized protein n=1 Tax=Halosaccharopolyspora lacisalsi TaxID=1000566 RepID=A0A839DWQ4_9PSEU|nr:hypothetical protein [Halosaccharopolyspora lacisalsi]MBA8825310.1 hypothetical protein [Halosaccharopolyspora lacisalsi]